MLKYISVLAFGAAVLTPTTGFAAQDTATITPTATIPLVCKIASQSTLPTITVNDTAQNLNTVSGTLNVNCNAFSLLTFTSANDWYLEGTAYNGTALANPYSFNVSEANWTFNSTYFYQNIVVGAVLTLSIPVTGSSGQNVGYNIQPTAGPGIIAGTYKDTIAVALNVY